MLILRLLIGLLLAVWLFFGEIPLGGNCKAPGLLSFGLIEGEGVESLVLGLAVGLVWEFRLFFELFFDFFDLIPHIRK